MSRGSKSPGFRYQSGNPEQHQNCPIHSDDWTQFAELAQSR